MNITAKTKICMVIGDPIDHSLSPLLHNTGYQALGIDNQFVYVGANVHIDNLADFIAGVKAMGIHGISCTMPHKLAVMQYLDELDETAKKIGAVNTIVNKNGKLIGHNTDWLGVITPLEKITSLKGKKVSVIGAGGAARAILYGLTKKQAKVTLHNRSQEKGNILAKEFSTDFSLLSNTIVLHDADIIINATSVGMHPHEQETAIDPTILHASQIIFDIIYNPHETTLLTQAKKIGAKTISGRDMLLYQGTEQFRLFTNHDAPEEIMKRVLYTSLS